MKKIAFIITTEHLLSPFMEPARDILILDRPLQLVQEEVFSSLGFEVKRGTKEEIFLCTNCELLVLTEDLFFTKELLEEFLALAKRKNQPQVQIAIKKNLFTKQLAILQSLPENETAIFFPLYYCHEGNYAEEDCPKVILEVEEFTEEGRFPPHMIGKDGYQFGVTSKPILRLHEGIHIALANMAANFARLARFRKLTPGQKLKTLFKSQSINKYSLLKALSVIEDGADIHPTAIIEGSIIRKGATVGAGAVIRHSVIGEGAFIDDHAGIKFSIVGAGAYIANNNVLFFSVVYPRAFLISGPYHFSCFGYDSAIMNSIPADYRLDGKTIRVKTSTGSRDTGLRFTGSIIGHRTRIAAGLIIAPGREIPNDLTLYPDPARVLTRVEDETAEKRGSWFLINGKLVNPHE